MLKKDIEWPAHRQFTSKKEWEPLYFFSECLCNSKSFDLSLGFFSSTAIRTLASGFATFLYNGGIMRLIINNILSEGDRDTILKGEKGEVEACFQFTDIKKIQATLSSYEQQFFDCISWLIANKRIEIVVIETHNNKGIAHTKSGVFYDGENAVGFNGSCNFTKTALLDNIESIDAHCDWDGSVFEAKILNLKKEFDLKFSKQDTSVRYIDPSQITISIQDNFKAKDILELLDKERDIIEGENNKLEINTAKLRPSLKRVLEKASLKVNQTIELEKKKRNEPKFPYPSGPRAYQNEAFENWKGNKQKGLFAMATGTGKTITSLNCLLEIYKRNGYYKALILVPTITLVNQWEKECKKFNFNNVIKVCSKNKDWKSEVANLNLAERLSEKGKSHSYVIISTYASFARENIFLELNSFPKSKLLLIADEAHNMGAGSLKYKLPQIKYARRIGLSATPERQFDEEGNRALLSFFGAEQEYTYNYSMKEAIEKGVLCKYYYYPHLVKLTDSEMESYLELSIKIAKYYSFNKKRLTKNDSILTALLLKRKQIIHKAANKKKIFKQILQHQISEKGDLKYTLVYVPEGNQVDEDADLFYDREDIIEDVESLHLIDQYTAIVRDIDKHTTVKQFTSSSSDRDQMIEDFSLGKLDVLTSMKCLDEGVDVPRSEMAVFCASTGNPRQFIQRRGRILRTHEDKHLAIIHDLVVAPEVSADSECYELEKNLLSSELRRVKNFSLLSENSSDTVVELENIMNYYNLSLFD